MKERLTGAIILVVLVVLLVPELLSGPKGPAAPPPAAAAASPSSEEPPLRSYTINLGDEHSQSQTANGAGVNSGPPQPSVQAQPATSADKDVSQSSTWDTATTEQQVNASGANPSASTPATNAGSSTASARSNSTAPSSARDQPPTHVATASTASSNPQLTAREQPKPTSAPKSSAAAAPKATSQPVGSRPEPAKPARATESAKPTAKPRAATEEKPAATSAESGGWGVQLGVFGSRENAERLVLQARVKGFKASVSPITSGKNKMYRVRVGPAGDKAAAQELQTRLKGAGIAHPDARVVPYS